MANTYDLIIDNKTIVVTPLSVQYLADFGTSYTLVLGSNNETFSITEDDYNAIKALDYSQGGGGGGEGGDSVSFTDNTQVLTINGTRHTIYGANNEAFSGAISSNTSAISAISGNVSALSGEVSGKSSVSFDDATNTLTIDGEEHTIQGGGGGSNMVYNTTTHILSGAKDQDGNDVEFEVGSVTITI